MPGHRIGPDAHLEAGEVLLQLTKLAAPCTNIAATFRDGDFARVAQKVSPGWSRVCARVVRAGVIRVGDAVTVRT